MPERDRPRIEGNLRQRDAWRASGLKMRVYIEAHGYSFGHWRFRLTVSRSVWLHGEALAQRRLAEFTFP